MKLIKRMTMVFVATMFIFSTAVYADDAQQNFLEDMSEGLRIRWESSGESESYTGQEYVSFNTELINIEYEKLAKYADTEFEDTRFGLLAHTYIRALETQLDALNYYLDADNTLYALEWADGYGIRAIIIPHLVDNYGLIADENTVNQMRDDAESFFYVIDE